ncbi:MAG TPA: 23S rRNA (uracil(1939)-C(5))-methyltransferase RlmD [Terracidiphilus sp.]|nr:23S rRNA (uracil(1939)-C(5))-methyltransferase RlmD [Terracidiphilus sp.]
MSQHATHLVQLEKPVYGGDFLARLDGKAIFVPLTLPGEQVQIRIVEDKRGYATAEVESLVQSAPQRVAPACPHFGACGGCQYQHADYASQLDFKQAILRETLERAGVPAPAEISVLAGAPWHYRNRIRMALDARGNAGYRGRGSHAVLPVSQCPIAAPLLLQAAAALPQALAAVAPTLRPSEITLFCNAEQTALLAGVVLAAPVRIPARNLADELAAALRERIPALCGLEIATAPRPHKPARNSARAPGRTATQTSAQILARWGSDSLLYRAAGFEYRVDHGAFFQVNRWLVNALVDHVTAELSGQLAWDLFAGVGLFARRLTANFAHVVAVESAPAAVAALAHNLQGTAASAVQADTLAFLRRKHVAAPDLIVLDPPRAGLGAPVTDALATLRAPALVYVSCDPATLARDLRALIAAGYFLHSVTLADLFPQTFHLETVVHLRLA